MTAHENEMLCRYFLVHQLSQKLFKNHKSKLNHQLKSSTLVKIDNTNDSSPYKNPQIQTCSLTKVSRAFHNSQYKRL